MSPGSFSIIQAGEKVSPGSFSIIQAGSCAARLFWVVADPPVGPVQQFDSASRDACATGRIADTAVRPTVSRRGGALSPPRYLGVSVPLWWNISGIIYHRDAEGTEQHAIIPLPVFLPETSLSFKTIVMEIVVPEYVYTRNVKNEPQAETLAPPGESPTRRSALPFPVGAGHCPRPISNRTITPLVAGSHAPAWLPGDDCGSTAPAYRCGG